MVVSVQPGRSLSPAARAHDARNAGEAKLAGNCGMVVPESEAASEGFMLTEQPTELDIIQMLGERPPLRRCNE